MKKLLISFLLVSSSVFAESISFDCKMPNLKYLGQFETSGELDVDDESQASGSITISFRDSGNDSTTYEIDLEVDGRVDIYEAGQLGKEEVSRLVYVNKGSEIEYMSLLIDYPSVIGSEIRKNGVSYKSNCTSN